LAQIAEAAVIGLPDDIFGEKVAAIIVLRPLSPPRQPHQKDADDSLKQAPQAQGQVIATDHNTSDVSPPLAHFEKNNKFQATKTLRDFLESRLAPYKQPREVFVVEHMPRNHLGKVKISLEVLQQILKD
jgi:acyl-coenzyme A synthetase/AMP-(fatty) acid ligase